jgi:predicted nucleic acid-binding Zn ribbon protein
MIYPYKCEDCGYMVDKKLTVKEMLQLEEQPLKCSKCGGKLIRSYDYNVGLVFKGDGFYVNNK